MWGLCLSIGVNDLHVAGHARSEGLVLVTNNALEFVQVSALEVENWVQAGLRLAKKQIRAGGSAGQ